MRPVLENIIIVIAAVFFIFLLSKLIDIFFHLLSGISKYMFSIQTIQNKITRVSTLIESKVKFLFSEQRIFLSTSLLLAVLIFIYYARLFQTYFQGDEWFFFSLYFPLIKDWIGLLTAVFNFMIDQKFIGVRDHLTPISHFLFALSLKLFGLNYIYYIASSLFIHILNSILVVKIMWKMVPDKKFIGIISGLFFGLSTIHQQSVTWIMTYLWTSLSVTFMLLAINELLKKLQPTKGVPFRPYLFTLFAIAPILTKESTIILFPVLLLLTFLLDKKLLKWAIRLVGIVFLFYIPYRFILPLFLPRDLSTAVASSVQSPFTIPLTIFRIITYPLKTLAEVFIPGSVILPITEELTPLAYPTYGAEKEVRGSNFLTFTQSAGSDIIIFMLATALLILITLLIFKLKGSKTLQVPLILGFSLIVLGALPLIMIAKYAPWWAYVTFIDSRHLYLPSIGAAMIFGVTTYYISRPISQLLKRLVFLKKFISPTKVLVAIVAFWMIANFNLLQKVMSEQVEMGTDRRNIVNLIMKDQPTLPERSIFLIDSDSAYYGFAELMPPFQTNFGKILVVHYYNRGQLPENFLSPEFLDKKGIVGQGYQEFDGRGFGYFLSIYKVAQLLEDRQLPINSVFSYKWSGKAHKIENNTLEVRGKLTSIENERSKYKSWQKISFSDQNLTLRLPENGSYKENTSNDTNILKEISITSPTIQINLKVRKKTNGVGINPNVVILTDSEGKIIGDNLTSRTILLNNGQQLSVTLTTTGKSIKYFFPTNVPPDKILEVTFQNIPSGTNNYSELAEKFISFIQFPDNIED